MTRPALRKLTVLSSLALTSLITFACGSNGGDGGGNGGGAPVGGSASGGTASGGVANPGGGNGNGGSAAPNGGGTGLGGGANVGGGVSTDGGGPGAGGGPGTDGGAPGTGGGSGSNNPIAGTDGYDCTAASGEIPELVLTQIPGQLTAPVDLAHPPNDDRLFIITLGGDVRIIKDGQLVETPFLSLGSRVAVGGAPGDERGLLGIAFHPDYSTNGLFYLHHSAGTGVPGAMTSDTVIVEYKVSAEPDVADPASARVVLIVGQPAGRSNHKGGAINFGPGKLLFIGLGDGGASNDPDGNGQDTGALLGKILRINPLKEGDNAYTTPPDNLVEEVSTAKPEIWDYGLRNPFRSSFDACTGDFYIGDVGQNQWEEIDVEKAGDGHKNYGWNRMEGLHCFDPANPNTSPADCDKNGITLPQIEVPDEEGTSITGGSVYRGASIPGLRGAYFYADYVSNRVWHTRYNSADGSVSTSVSVTQELNPKQIVAIRNGNDGELYFVSLGAITGGTLGPGGIYKLEAAE